MTFLIIFGAVAAVYSIALLFRAAVYALPICCGLAAFFAMQRVGWTYPVAIGAGILTGAMLLVIAQACAQISSSPLVRAVIALAFGGPAATASYHATHAIAGHWIGNEAVLLILAASAALITGAASVSTVFAKQRCFRRPVQPPS